MALYVQLAQGTAVQGYYTDGIAMTAKAAKYPPKFSAAIAHAVTDSCVSDQEG